jgi:hypothetical protein
MTTVAVGQSQTLPGDKEPVEITRTPNLTGRDEVCPAFLAQTCFSQSLPTESITLKNGYFAFSFSLILAVEALFYLTHWPPGSVFPVWLPAKSMQRGTITSKVRRWTGYIQGTKRKLKRN